MKVQSNMANMGVMSVYHPDIEEFLEAKATDPKRLCHFNLSVMVDDAFMYAAKKGDYITLHWPVYDDVGNIENDRDKWKVSKSINAKELWDKIIRKAYDNGEPGVLFYDTMNGYNPLYYTEKIRCTNPCFTGDMRLLTKDGYKAFRELDGKEVEVVAVNGHITHGKVWKSGTKKTVLVEFENGTQIKCTPNHVFMLEDGGECKAADLLWSDKKVKTFNGEPQTAMLVAESAMEDVYDFTEPETHWGVVEGFVVHNCAEYLSGTVYGQELSPSEYGGACNLGSLMLQNFVVCPFTSDAYLDLAELGYVIGIAVRMLDNIIDKNQFPDKIYENYQKTFRTIGLGVTGLADALCMLGYKYDSQEARDYVSSLMDFISWEAYEASTKLAEEKGAFPGFDEKYLCNNFLNRDAKLDWGVIRDKIKKHGIRNAKLLAIAPTGTMSIVYGNNCSSGIEPIFSLSYDRKVKIGSQADDAEQTVSVEDYAYHVFKQKRRDGDKEGLFRTALDISVYDHLAMLAAISKHVDMSVSKTINIPTEYSFEETKKVYETAWQLGVKGCTIFRPNALRPGIFNTQVKETSKEVAEIPRGMIEDVPEGLTYRKYKIQSACGSLYLFVGVDEAEGRIYDFFTNTDGVGGCVVSTQANSRLMSAALRGGVPIEYIIEQLLKSGSCPSFQYARGQGKHLAKGKSCASAIAYKLQDLVKELEQDSDEDVELSQQEVVVSEPDGEICPECGQKGIVHEGGCMCCKACGYSKCS